MTHRVALFTKAFIFRPNSKPTHTKKKERLTTSPTLRVVSQFGTNKVHLFYLFYSMKSCHACGITLKVLFKVPPDNRL